MQKTKKKPILPPEVSLPGSIIQKISAHFHLKINGKQHCYPVNKRIGSYKACRCETIATRSGNNLDQRKQTKEGPFERDHCGASLFNEYEAKIYSTELLRIFTIHNYSFTLAVRVSIIYGANFYLKSYLNNDVFQY